MWFVLVCFTDETLELVVDSAWFAHIARRWLQGDGSWAMGRQFKEKRVGIGPELLEQSLLKIVGDDTFITIELFYRSLGVIYYGRALRKRSNLCPVEQREFDWSEIRLGNC